MSKSSNRIVRDNMQRERKKKNFPFYCLNIRLFSSDRKASEAVPGMLESLRRKKVWKKVKGETRIIVRNFWKIEFQEEDFFGGYFSKYTSISGKWLDFEKMEAASLETPKNMFPNLRDSDFYFVPSIHRIFVEKTSHTSLVSVIKYLEMALNEQAKPGENVKVIMESSEAILDRIYTASAVRKLNLTVTYSNDDDYAESVKAMDKYLRKGRVGTAKLNFSPDDSESLLVRESPLLHGLMELANSNGEIDSTIINEKGKREKVLSSRYPRLFTVRSVDIARLPFNLYQMAKGVFRRVR